MCRSGRMYFVAVLLMGVGMLAWAGAGAVPQVSSGKTIVDLAPTGPVAPPVNLAQDNVGDVPEEPPAPPVQFAPHAVLWDQPVSSVNTGAYVDQDFPDYPTYSSYLADDFTNAGPWSITSIFVPGGGWNGFSSLANATALNWAIYADGGGVPDGDPSGGGNAPVWSLSLLPSDPQVTLTVNPTFGFLSDTLVTLSAPVALPPGTYWFVFYPTMALSGGGQYGRQASDTANGATAQFINPGGGFGLGTAWQNWTVLGAAQTDLAFRIEGDLGSCTVLYDNGPLVTHVAGCSGQDASRLQTGLGMNTLGFGHQFLTGNRMADDFTVTDAGGWQVDQIDFFAYQTGAPTTSPITGVYYQIWDGPPNAGGTVIFGDLTTNRLTATEFTNIQRDSETSSCANNRYIFRNTCSAGVSLPAGTYWIDWMTDGSLSSGPWAPPITILGQTTTGNALQYTTSSGAWAPALDSGTLTQQGMPFVLYTCAAGCPTITIDPAPPLPAMQRAVPWSVTFTASGGTAPYTYTLTGTIPPGLVWDPATATLSGTPTWAGTYDFTIDVMDDNECPGTQAYTAESAPTYTLNFYDNLGRAQLCIDSVTGHYHWATYIPGAMDFFGQGVVANGGTAFWTTEADAIDIYAVHDIRRHRARAYLTDPGCTYSSIVDSNTVGNPACP